MNLSNNEEIRELLIKQMQKNPQQKVEDVFSTSFEKIFAEIDKKLEKGKVIVAIEGGSASGKSTLAKVIKEIYDCNLFHMDDFFLRPEQRTTERFSEVGGNVDRERFYIEVINSLVNNKVIKYRPFDCMTQSLKEPITVSQKQLTVIEGVYSMHPSFGEYYNLAIFLDINVDCQKDRIQKRNSPIFAKRFFEEWIPLENIYFDKTNIRNRCDMVIPIE